VRADSGSTKCAEAMGAWAWAGPRLHEELVKEMSGCARKRSWSRWGSGLDLDGRGPVLPVR
jgi:hypothetical protein